MKGIKSFALGAAALAMAGCSDLERALAGLYLNQGPSVEFKNATNRTERSQKIRDAVTTVQGVQLRLSTALGSEYVGGVFRKDGKLSTVACCVDIIESEGVEAARQAARGVLKDALATENLQFDDTYKSENGVTCVRSSVLSIDEA